MLPLQLILSGGPTNLSLSATAGRSLRGCLSSKPWRRPRPRHAVPGAGAKTRPFGGVVLTTSHEKVRDVDLGDPVGSFLGQVLPLFLAV